jgi:hypothetical protein
VRYRNPHLTWHTFATRFLRNRERLETLQLELCHESIQTTADLYGHLDIRDVALDLGLLQESPRSEDVSVQARRGQASAGMGSPRILAVRTSVR